jgi:Zinc carboxypeptidase
VDRIKSTVTQTVVCTLALLLAASAAAAVPDPASHFGHPIGVDNQLLDWDKVVSYFNLLAKTSDKIQVREIGKTAEGRPVIAATIAAPETLRKLDHFLEIQRRLADPRITTPEEAAPLISEARNVVLLTCSIHATEVASTHSAVEFAYRILTEDKPHFRFILQNDIIILVPSLNPDGVDIVTRWYRKTLGTEYEGTSPPELWHKYVGHDNNRDWYIFSQPETRAVVSQLHNLWHPQIVYDVHQQGMYGSRIFVPPWMDPIEPNVDAVIAEEQNMIGTSMAVDLTAAGQKGVSIHSLYDFWSPARHYQSFHAGLRILTESASVRLASPVTVKFSDLDREALGYDAQQRSWNFLEPWPGGAWRLRDIVDDQLIAFESCLYNAALHREDMVRNFFEIGRRAIARTSPWAVVIPATQRDPGATRRMLETLAFGAVEIERAPDGGHIVRMQQPYSSYAKALLERQQYPDLRLYPGGPPKRPYDVTAHTLPLLFGVNVKLADAPVPGPFTHEQFPFFATPKSSYSASDTDTWFTVNRLWRANRPVWRNEVTGDFSDAPQAAGWKQAARPRVGLYKSFMPSMDEGWTRWLLEQFGFEYTSLRNADVQAPNLRAKYDVIVFPDQSAAEIRNGYAAGRMPAEFTGGLGTSGATALKQFAESGGKLIFLNHSTLYAVAALGINARNVVSSVSNRDFYSPGSLLNVKLDLAHPLTRGLPENIAIWSEGSPAFESEERSAATYPESGILASGWLLGEKLIAKRSALLDAKVGSGRVILFGFRPQYRAQSYQAFKLFFNALIM